MLPNLAELDLTDNLLHDWGQVAALVQVGGQLRLAARVRSRWPHPGACAGGLLAAVQFLAQQRQARDAGAPVCRSCPACGPSTSQPTGCSCLPPSTRPRQSSPT